MRCAFRLRSMGVVLAALWLLCLWPLMVSCLTTSHSATPADAAADSEVDDATDAAAEATALWDGARSDCSTGPPYEAGTFLPDDPNWATQPPAPDCIPRCEYVDYKPSSGHYPQEAIPSGACAVENEVCSMIAAYTCLCNYPGPVAGFRCTCRAGNWSCMQEGDPGSGCECPSDASTD